MYRRTVEEAFFPLAVMIDTVPIVAIAPILVLLFGPDLAHQGRHRRGDLLLPDAAST